MKTIHLFSILFLMLTYTYTRSTQDLKQPIYYSYTIKNNYTEPIKVDFTVTKKPDVQGACYPGIPAGQNTRTLQPGEEFDYGDDLGSICPISKISFEPISIWTHKLGPGQIARHYPLLGINYYKPGGSLNKDPYNINYLARLNKKIENNQSTQAVLTIEYNYDGPSPAVHGPQV